MKVSFVPVDPTHKLVWFPYILPVPTVTFSTRLMAILQL